MKIHSYEENFFSRHGGGPVGFLPIEGTLTGDAASGKAYLERSEYQAEPTVVDSTMVENGSFTFSGKVERPGLYYVVIDLNKPGEEPDYQNKMFRTMLYLENSDITYKGDVATLPGFYYAPDRKNESPQITGSSVRSVHEDESGNEDIF